MTAISTLPDHDPLSALFGSAYDLDIVAQDSLTRLKAASKDRRHPMHVPVVTTVDADGAPQSRMMVLRALDADQRTLRFHTDARSPKTWAGDRGLPAQVLLYDPQDRIQLRLSGVAQILTEGPQVAQAWAESQLMSRRCYLTEGAPGRLVDSPMAEIPPHLIGKTPTAMESEAGRDNFALLLFRFDQIDWLHLSHLGNRAMRIAWVQESQTLSWLAP